jgi:hypothetical protein
MIKITTTKWTGGMAQAVEHLLCKCEALGSNTSPTKERERERDRKYKTTLKCYFLCVQTLAKI